MANMLDYINWRGDLTFKQSPFNLVDNLILSCLSYVVMDGIVGGFDSANGVSVKELADSFEQLSKDEKNLRDPKDETLLVSMGQSKRFGHLQLFYYEQQIDHQAEKQFAAVTIALEKDVHYISYRGTDFTVTGWKEDFNMTFRTGVPAQQEAVRYLKQVAQETKGKLYIGGHSKGGNLATFAAAFAGSKIQQRIVAVYNNDGPGFLEDVIDSAGYQAIYEKIQTFIPQTSLFGMMLEHAEPFTILESSQHFVMQHDPYSWNVLGPDFIYLEKVTASSRFLDQTIRGWLASLTPEQREQFVDTMFDLLTVEEADTLQDLGKLWLTNTGDMLKTLRNVDEETANMIRQTLKLLAQNMGRSVQQLIFTRPSLEKLPRKEKLDLSVLEQNWAKLPQLFQKKEKTPQHHVIEKHKK